MLRHSEINNLTNTIFKHSLTKFIRGIIVRDYGQAHTGTIKEIVHSGGKLFNIIIEITDVEESPHLSWSDGHFIIRQDDIFSINDPVLLLSVRGRYFVLKIEDDFTVRNNSGTGQITSAATSDVITHELGITPKVEDMHIIFTTIATNNIGHMWIDTITPTQFTVRVKNAPGSNLDFSWKVDAK